MCIGNQRLYVAGADDDVKTVKAMQKWLERERRSSWGDAG